MKRNNQHNYGGLQHNRGGLGESSTLKIVATIIAVAVVVGLSVFAYRFLFPTPLSEDLARMQTSSVSQSTSSAVQEAGEMTAATSEAMQDFLLSEQAAQEEAMKEKGLPTPVIANYQDILIHTPIAPKELQGILFHQASFETALPLETQLPYADPEKMEIDADYQIAEEQPTGNEWLDGLGLHLWRADTATEMDTSIDVGGEAGTQVYSPIDGTVVKVNTYDLYETVEDYEIHIQPTGHAELDLVIIHIDSVSVKEGDKVVAGVTPVAIVRDLAGEDITDIQLSYYTREEHGNHTHIQLNNADYPEYRETRLKDAYKVEE